MQCLFQICETIIQVSSHGLFLYKFGYNEPSAKISTATIRHTFHSRMFEKETSSVTTNVQNFVRAIYSS